MLAGYAKYCTITVPAGAAASDQAEVVIPFRLAADATLVANALASGFDVVPSLADGTVLKFVRAVWDAASGELSILIRWPTVLSATDNVIYLNVGNSAALDQQSLATTYVGYGTASPCAADLVAGAPDSVVKDLSPFAVDGVVSAGALAVARTPLPCGFGYYFDGTQGLTYAGDRLDPLFYTQTVWYQDLALGSDGGATIFNVGDAADYDTLRAEDKGGGSFAIKHDDLANKLTLNAPTAGAHKFTVSYNDATQTMTAYIDGVQAGQSVGGNILAGVTTQTLLAMRMGDSDWPDVDLALYSSRNIEISADREALEYAAEVDPVGFYSVSAWQDNAPVSTAIDIVVADLVVVSVAGLAATTLAHDVVVADLVLGALADASALTLSHGVSVADLATTSLSSSGVVSVSVAVSVADLAVDSVITSSAASFIYSLSGADIAVSSAVSFAALSLSHEGVVADLAVSATHSVGSLSIAYDLSVADLAVVSAAGLDVITLGHDLSVADLALNSSAGAAGLSVGNEIAIADLAISSSASVAALSLNPGLLVADLAVSTALSVGSLSIVYGVSAADQSVAALASSASLSLVHGLAVGAGASGAVIGSGVLVLKHDVVVADLALASVVGSGLLVSVIVVLSDSRLSSESAPLLYVSDDAAHYYDLVSNNVDFESVPAALLLRSEAAQINYEVSE